MTDNPLVDGSPLDYGAGDELSYWFSPDQVSELIQDPGIPESLSAEAEEYLAKIGKTYQDVTIHYCASDKDSSEQIRGMSVMYIDDNYDHYGKTLAAVMFGEITWDSVRRSFEVLEKSESEIKNPINLVFDYTKSPTSIFRQLNLSFVWNEDLLPYTAHLIERGLLDKAYLRGMAKSKNINVLLQALAETAMLTMPLLKGHILFDS